jgi:hypothetical protein
MMRRVWKPALAGLLSIVTAFAGALVLQTGDPAANPEAQAKNAAVLVRIAACHSPEKTTVTAVAIGETDGKLQTITLQVISLSTPGTLVVTHEWPEQGNWVVKFVARNPDYVNYATGALVPANGATVDWHAAKQFWHEPSNEEVASMLRAGQLSATRR